ncbi:MAG TPA: zf-TFIIB domain-containing protein [Holophagaceae bacterium]
MEARAIRCSSCGASVPADAPQCPYCQAQLATVACPACFALVPLSASHCPACGAAIRAREAGTPDGAPCPACTKPLGRAQVGELAVQECLACGGLWLEREAFEGLAASREGQGAVLGALPGQAPKAGSAEGLAAVQYRPCPRCAQRMNRVNYAKRSGVVLDVCKDHGLWFDRDELRRVLVFIQEGGLDRSRERDLEDLKEAQRTVARPGPSGESFGLGLDAPPPSTWITGTSLTGLLLGAARHLLDRD